LEKKALNSTVRAAADPLESWSPEERPRERYESLGIHALTDSELLALLIGSGSRGLNAVAIGRNLLKQAGFSWKRLSEFGEAELRAVHGMGRVKALRLLAAFELGRRQQVEVPDPPVRISDSEGIYRLLRPELEHLPHEEFWMVFLNNSHRVLLKEQLSKGGITGTLVDIRLVLKKALLLGAVALVVAHNHPSGNLTPSASDRHITRRLKEAAELLDLKLLDHVIIAREGYYSFSDQELL